MKHARTDFLQRIDAVLAASRVVGVENETTNERIQELVPSLYSSRTNIAGGLRVASKSYSTIPGQSQVPTTMKRSSC